ncbi:MAG: precorrin-3B C(17)-methyltransferase [Alphaproteobacteria bacterium]|nr:precorrin-3B C(17)-methyltransferase [Alphaproteobacteria bacterium]
MTGLLPEDIAIIALGPASAALGCRLRAALPGARLHGPKAHPGDWDESYDRAASHIGRLFEAGRPIVGLCASGILIRSVAAFLAAKREEPAVVAVAEDGSVVVPLIGGHHGANALARRIAELTGGTAAITTAGDVHLGIALDEPPPGWHIADQDRVKPVVAALLRGEPVSLTDETGCASWLHGGDIRWAEHGNQRVIVTDRRAGAATDALVFHPPLLVLGIGCERGCSAEEIADLARSALAQAGLAPEAVAAVVSVELKLAEPAIHALAAQLGVPARFFPASRLLLETPRLSEPSAAAFRATGCWGVAEGAALAGAGPDGVLVVPKQKSRRATCAIARAMQPIAAESIGRPRGRLAVLGIGPGDPSWRTPEASAALEQASDIVGYRLYLDLLGRAIEHKRRHANALGEERARVRLAFDLAAEGKSVALVSSGDPGIYGLAPLVFELLDTEGKAEWSTIDLMVLPGISALQVAASRAGAPLGHDFCAISLSDLMTPWETIRSRLEAAARADFVVALYNPRSARRHSQLTEAADILLCHRTPETPVFVGRNLGRNPENHLIIRLSELSGADVDMLTIVVVGNTHTRWTNTDPPRLYTPRGYFNRAVS